MALNWMAFALPSTNPVLAETLSLITSHTKLTPQLQDKVEQAIKVGYFLVYFNAFKNCSIHGTAADGQTILHAACYSGILELVTLLVEKYNANIDSQVKWRNLQF